MRLALVVWLGVSCVNAMVVLPDLRYSAGGAANGTWQPDFTPTTTTTPGDVTIAGDYGAGKTNLKSVNDWLSNPRGTQETWHRFTDGFDDGLADRRFSV